MSDRTFKNKVLGILKEAIGAKSAVAELEQITAADLEDPKAAVSAINSLIKAVNGIDAKMEGFKSALAEIKCQQETEPDAKPAEGDPEPKPAENDPDPKPTEDEPDPKPAEGEDDPEPKPSEDDPAAGEGADGLAKAVKEGMKAVNDTMLDLMSRVEKIEKAKGVSNQDRLRTSGGKSKSGDGDGERVYSTLLGGTVDADEVAAVRKESGKRKPTLD